MKALKSYWAILLGLFFTLAYLIPIQTRLLFQPDETRYAEISREMLARGDWIVPHQLGLRYFEKPSGGYWINNISQWLFGDSNFAVRFGSVFSTAISAALIFVLAWLFWRQWRKSFIAVFIYLSMTLVFSVGTYSLLDPMITLWMTAAMVSFYLTLQAKNWQGKVGAYVLLGIACGMGFMTKGFLALAVPVIAVIPIVIQQRRIKELLIYGPVAIIAAALLSLPWALAINAREPDFWNYFFWVEHIQRFAEKDAQHKEPFWYYLPVLCAAVLPWLALLPGALKLGWQQRVAKPELFFLLSWAVMPLIFFSVAKGKLPTYILPCMAPLALLMTAYAEDCVAALRQRVFKVNAGINIAFGAIGVIALLLVGTGLLPKARVFTAQEWPKLLLGLVLFSGWIVFAWLSWRQNARRWLWAVGCPLLLCLLVGYTLPQMVVDSKQPQGFIDKNLPTLTDSRFVLSNSVGVAAGLAWQLKRSDITMFNAQGEVKYGLSYPDAKDNYVSDDDFPAWLAQARKQGNVSVVLQLSRNETPPVHLPPADKTESENRIIFLFYKQQP